MKFTWLFSPKNIIASVTSAYFYLLLVAHSYKLTNDTKERNVAL